MINKTYKLQSIAVWLIIIEGINAGKIALQKRAKKDNGKPQSFPFMFQPIVNGKLDTGETPQQAVHREATEELGSNFTLPELEFFYKEEYACNGKPAIAYNFKGQISQKDLENITLHSGAFSKLFFLDKSDLPNIKTTEKGSDPQKETVLFEDQLEALKKLF